jgi:glucose-1-phosphate adenylyltransferase
VPAPERHYFGSADALFRGFQFLHQETEHVLVLSADHIYEMDYGELLRFHIDKGADATLASIVYPSRASRHFGILGIDESSRVVSFEEKPALPKELPGLPGNVLANMGVYVFRREVFLDAFRRDSENKDSHHDIGRDVLPALVAGSTVYAFQFAKEAGGNSGYWRDVGTLDSYYDASMEWLGCLPATHRLSGSTSVISDGVRVHSTAEVRDSVLMPGVVVGAGARVRRAILDENVHVMPGARIGFGNADSRDFLLTSNGICIVPSNTIVLSQSRRTQGGRHAHPLAQQLSS